MNVVIIEDEIRAGEDLKTSILDLQSDANVLTIINSVENGLEWFNSSSTYPDIIFSDIQLGDGLAFDILSAIHVSCPVIFCTAYDQYAMQAFKSNGIEYLLKPITKDALQKSLDKFKHFKLPIQEVFDNTLLNDLMKQIIANSKSYKTTFLVAYKSKMIPIRVDDIMFFGILEDGTELRLKNNQRYNLNLTLDYIESIVAPSAFFRANRQYLVAYQAIKEVEHHFDRKLLIQLTLPNVQPLIVSKAKASEFLNWLENR